MAVQYGLVLLNKGHPQEYLTEHGHLRNIRLSGSQQQPIKPSTAEGCRPF
jgi:hypothetical protein